MKSSSRLASKFRLWFLLVLILPIGFLIYFSTVSLSERRILIRETIRENQLSQVLSIEEFFRNRFRSVHSQVIQDSFDQLASAFSQYDAEFSDESDESQLSRALTLQFRKKIFPLFGFQIPEEIGYEKGEIVAHQMFCRFQLASLRPRPEKLRTNRSTKLNSIRDIFDIIGVSPTRGLDGSKFSKNPANFTGCDMLEGPEGIPGSCKPFLVYREIENLREKVRLREDLLYTSPGEQKLDLSVLRKIFKPLKILDQEESLSVSDLTQVINTYQTKSYELFLAIREAYYKERRLRSGSEGYTSSTEKTRFGKVSVLAQKLGELRELVEQTFSASWLSGEQWNQFGRPPTFYLDGVGKTGLQNEKWLLFGNSLNILNFRLDVLLSFKSESSNFSIDVKEYFLNPVLLLDKVKSLIDPDDSDWKLVSRLLLHLVRYSFSGDLSLDEKASLGATAMVRTRDLKQTRNTPLPMAAARGEIGILWDLVPRNFQIEDFVSGLGDPPRALLVSILKQHDLIFHFVRLFRAICQLPGYEEGSFFQDLEESYFKGYLRREELIPSFGDAHQEVSQAIMEMARLWSSGGSFAEFPGFLDFFLHEIGLNPAYPLDRKESWKRSTEIELLPLRSLIHAEFFKDGDFADKRIRAVIGSALDEEVLKNWFENPQEILTFEYEDKSGIQRIGTLVESGDLNDFVFFLSLDAKTAYQEIDYILLLLLGMCSLAILVSLGLGAKISKLVVEPVNLLSNEVKTYGGGASIEPLEIRRFDELGKMTDLFNSMVERIDQRVSEMEAINEVNSLLLKGQKLKELMAHVARRFTALTGARVGFIGFFEQDSMERLLASHLFERDGGQAYERDQIEKEFFRIGVKKTTENLQEDILRRLPDDLQVGLEYGSIHYQSIKPAVQGLDDIEEVLEKFSEEKKENPDRGEMKLQGFVILVDAEENLLSEEKLEFLKKFGNQAATVLLKAYLDQVREESLEGQSVQESLMPAEAPGGRDRLDVSSSFVAAKYLGGDFYDFLSPGNGEVGFFISDVSGKGIGPALFGATSKAYLRLLSESSEDTGSTLREMNEYLCQFQYEQLFATAFYISIDPESLKAQYSSAGHNRMILIRKNCEEIEFLSAKGLVLGMFFPCKYETRTLELGEGDLLVLYTDGITEFENPELELYGNERFESLLLKNRDLDSEELKGKILADMEEFGRGQAQSDDVTLVIVKIKPRYLQNGQPGASDGKC